MVSVLSFSAIPTTKYGGHASNFSFLVKPCGRLFETTIEFLATEEYDGFEEMKDGECECIIHFEELEDSKYECDCGEDLKKNQCAYCKEVGH